VICGMPDRDRPVGLLLLYLCRPGFNRSVDTAAGKKAMVN